MSAATLEAGHTYLSRAWSVVPVPRGQKIPVLNGWQDLRLTADDLAEHFTNGQNIGLLLGEPSGGLVDVDLDCPQAVALAPAFLPATPLKHGRPHRRSSHWWYVVGDPPRTKRYEAPDGAVLVELRGTGGQTIVPPSLHPDGEEISWEGAGDPATVALDALRRSVACLAAGSLLAASWPVKGSRDNASMALAGGMLRAGWNEHQVERFIYLVANAAGDEEARDRSRKPFATARKLEAGRDATGWPALAKIVGNDTVERVREWLGIRSERVEDAPRLAGPAVEWPEPLAGEAMHGLVGRIVQAIEPHSEADRAALLLHLLTGAGALVGPYTYAVAGDARHPGRLFGLVVGQTSKGRKGSSARPVERLLALADGSFAPSRVAEGLSSGEGVIWQVRDPIYKMERRGKDSEPEEAMVDPGVSDKRLWVVESEFASALRVMQREGNTLSTLIRRAWDTGDLRTMTKNTPAVATGAHVSIAGHITRDELLRYLDRSELASGLANRFLCAASRRGRSLPNGEGVPAKDLEPLAVELRCIQSWARVPRQLRRDPEAADLWEQVYEPLSEGQPGMFGAATNRGEAQVLRLSVLYAILDCSDEIQAEHLLAALAVWRYAEASARWIFGDATGDPIADTILGALRQGSLARNDMVNLLHRNVSRDRIDRALAQLLAAGRVRREQDTDTGGRPAEVWHAVAATETRSTDCLALARVRLGAIRRGEVTISAPPEPAVAPAPPSAAEWNGSEQSEWPGRYPTRCRCCSRALLDSELAGGVCGECQAREAMTGAPF